ncbi:unnamed protein product [Ectocarpus sp. 4 AP-2014]
MVTLLMSPIRQQSIATGDCDVEENFDALVLEDEVGNTWEGDDLPKICTFWCAISIGAAILSNLWRSTSDERKKLRQDTQARQTSRWQRRGRYWRTCTAL